MSTVSQRTLRRRWMKTAIGWEDDARRNAILAASGIGYEIPGRPPEGALEALEFYAARFSTSEARSSDLIAWMLMHIRSGASIDETLIAASAHGPDPDRFVQFLQTTLVDAVRREPSLHNIRSAARFGGWPQSFEKDLLDRFPASDLDVISASAWLRHPALLEIFNESFDRIPECCVDGVLSELQRRGLVLGLTVVCYTNERAGRTPTPRVPFLGRRFAVEFAVRLAKFLFGRPYPNINAAISVKEFDLICERLGFVPDCMSTADLWKLAGWWRVARVELGNRRAPVRLSNLDARADVDYLEGVVESIQLEPYRGELPRDPVLRYAMSQQMLATEVADPRYPFRNETTSQWSLYYSDRTKLPTWRQLEAFFSRHPRVDGR